MPAQALIKAMNLKFTERDSPLNRYTKTAAACATTMAIPNTPTNSNGRSATGVPKTMRRRICGSHFGGYITIRVPNSRAERRGCDGLALVLHSSCYAPEILCTLCTLHHLARHETSNRVTTHVEHGRRSSRIRQDKVIRRWVKVKLVTLFIIRDQKALAHQWSGCTLQLRDCVPNLDEARDRLDKRFAHCCKLLCYPLLRHWCSHRRRMMLVDIGIDLLYDHPPEVTSVHPR